MRNVEVVEKEVEAMAKEKEDPDRTEEGADLEALCSLPRHLSTTRPCSPGEKTRQPTPRTHLVSSGPSIRPEFYSLSLSPSISLLPS